MYGAATSAAVFTLVTSTAIRLVATTVNTRKLAVAAPCERQVRRPDRYRSSYLVAYLGRYLVLRPGGCPIQNMLRVRRVPDLGALNKSWTRLGAAVREDVRVPDEIQDNLRMADDVACLYWRRAASRKWGKLNDD